MLWILNYNGLQGKPPAKACLKKMFLDFLARK
jgi:hypothetical protein